MSVRFVTRALASGRLRVLLALQASGRLRMFLALQQGREVRIQARLYPLLIAATAASPAGAFERREALINGRGVGRERGDDARLDAAAQRILTRGKEGILTPYAWTLYIASLLTGRRRVSLESRYGRARAAGASGLRAP